MKYLSNFKMFESKNTDHEFTEFNKFNDFCEKNVPGAKWSVTTAGYADKSDMESTKRKAKKFFDLYCKPGFKFVVTTSPKVMLGIIDENGEVTKAFDKDDRNCLSDFKEYWSGK